MTLVHHDDWLVIAVDARTADGCTWSFSDPCLTTEEAARVSGWLRRQDVETTLGFIEPNLEFQWLTSRRLQVSFSHESLPPWLPDSRLGDVYPLVLDVAAGDLAAAADQWDREIRPFPRRAPA